MMTDKFKDYFWKTQGQKCGLSDCEKMYGELYNKYIINKDRIAELENKYKISCDIADQAVKANRAMSERLSELEARATISDEVVEKVRDRLTELLKRSCYCRFQVDGYDEDTICSDHEILALLPEKK